ncbi:MAG: maleylpyruvate isomerase family mycothiol-dependent enzyme [Acidimicrobiia bacterium]
MHDGYIATLRSDASAFAGAVRRVDMDAPVPSCPDWTARDLLVHMGAHHRWVRANLDRQPEDGMAPGGVSDPAPEGRAASAWVEEGAAELADRLDEAGPDRRCWTWVADLATTGFWARRTANETAVHRWDMENAAGIPGSIDAALAVDGIAEQLAIVQRGFVGPPPTGAGETIHLHATDADGEWLVRLDAEGMEVMPEHGKGDVALRGPASDLLLVVLGRLPASVGEVLGDEQLLSRWLEKTGF